MTRRTKNPVTKYLATFSLLSLSILGVSALMEWRDLASLLTEPLIFGCSLLLVAYTLWSLRLGWISSHGSFGQTYVCVRKKEPILFYFLVSLYLLLAVPIALLMAYLMIWS